MTTPSDEYRWAIYDEYDFKLRGGFSTREAAETWLRLHPPIIVWDGENEVRVGSEYEADLIRAHYPNIQTRHAAKYEYRVLVETD